MTTITGQSASSLLPPTDTPENHPAFLTRHDGLSRAQIARVIPRGSRCVRSQREALRAGLACPDLAEVRADRRANLTAWWRLHVLHMSWGGDGRPPAGTTQPTRARVCALAGFGVSTYKTCRQWWEARGYVAIVRPGRTPALRPLALVRPGDGNERQVLVICCPLKKRPISSPRSGQTITRPLTCSGSEQVFPSRVARPAGKPGSSSVRPTALRTWPLRGVSAGWWSHLIRPFAAAGWSFTDLIWAIDHEPGGRARRERLANVVHPVGWLRWRLAAWLDPDGRPLPSPAQQRAAAAEAHRAYLAERERIMPFAARAAAIRQAYPPEPSHSAGDDVSTAERLAQLRARLGKPLGQRWRDPAEVARRQLAESRASRGG